VGEKSMALRLVFNKDDAGLTDSEIETAMNGLVKHLATQVGARLRG